MLTQNVTTCRCVIAYNHVCLCARLCSWFSTLSRPWDASGEPARRDARPCSTIREQCKLQCCIHNAYERLRSRRRSCGHRETSISPRVQGSIRKLLFDYENRYNDKDIHEGSNRTSLIIPACVIAIVCVTIEIQDEDKTDRNPWLKFIIHVRERWPRMLVG